MPTDEEINKKLDTLITLLTPQAPDPKHDSLVKAEAIIREALKEDYPKDKLDSWSLETLLTLQEAKKVRILPDPIGKEDSANKDKEEKVPKTLSKEDADREAHPFKYASQTYTKEVGI
jgi:hypothetical protein